MDQRNFDQVATTQPYHEPVEAHGFHLSTVVLVIFGVVIAAMVIVGAIVDTQQVATASTILIQIVAVLAIVGLPLMLIAAVWHKAYLDTIKRKHARIDLQAKEDQARRENEAHHMRMYLAESRLHADERGNRPYVLDKATGQVLQIASGNYVQPVPTHLHQEYNYSDTSTGRAQELAAAQAAHGGYEQPALETIIEELTPNTLEFAFGMDPLTGQLVKTTLPKSVHIQLLGATGQGKSRQATSILTQLCARNDTQHLGLALIDCEGETTAPFQGLPHVRYIADEPKEAGRIFKALVSELERRDISRVVWPVLFIFVEEFLNLRRTMPAEYRDQALEDYTTLALRGRKRGMFLFAIGQTAYSEKAIRDAQGQFLSSMAFAVKPTAARSAGFTNTDLLNRLYSERRPGQFLLERPAGDSILLAPYVDPRFVPALLAPDSLETETSVESALIVPPQESQEKATRKQPRNQGEDALQAKGEQVRQLIASGCINKADILLAVWGVRPGSSEKYRHAEQEYKHIMVGMMEAQ